MTIKVKHNSSKIRYPNPTRPKKRKFRDPYRFYVYMWLRSKDSITGKAGTPYYVGKGFSNRAYRKGGPIDKSNIVIVESGMLEEDALELEIKVIAQYGRVDLGTGILRNKTDGGEGTSGRKYNHTENSIQKMSIAHTGEKNPMYGKKQSIEHIEKKRISALGKTRNIETKQKMSIAHTGEKNSMYGKKQSIEHRKKNSIANKGRKLPKSVCPHCGFIGTLNKYHLDKCKYHPDKINDLLENIKIAYKSKPSENFRREIYKIITLIDSRVK